MVADVPKPHEGAFRDGIVHPDLYLWDAWSYVEDDASLHLYTLAVGRKGPDGAPLAPQERNAVPFHVRHFLSHDLGESWRDEGCLIAPRSGQGLPDSGNIWSGSIERLPDGRKLVAYTGLYDLGEARCFVQNIMLAISDGYAIERRMEAPLLCPLRDREAIIGAGYYLAAPEAVGSRDGEDGGPVMAWRDPFIFQDRDGQLHLFWSAKIGPKAGAMGHGLLAQDGDGFRLEKLLPPVTLPDGDAFTQLELPKVYHDARAGTYYLVTSTCNRLDERQPDAEVDKRIRLHLSDSLDGPWTPWSAGGSVLPGLDGLFGMTVLQADFVDGSLLCAAPYTDAAGPDLRLTFRPCFRIGLDPVAIAL